MASTTPVRFPFGIDPRYRLPAMLVGVGQGQAWVEVGEATFEVKFGPWHVNTPLDNIVSAEASGPYAFFKTVGPPHLSLRDRGLTFATNAARGVCVRFAQPVRGIDPLGLLRHPGLTVTVADVDGLLRKLQDVSAARTPAEELWDLQDAVDNLHTMTASQLRDLADEHGVARPSGLKKAEIVDLLQTNLDPQLLAKLAER